MGAHLQNGGVDMTSEDKEQEDSNDDDNGMGRRRSEDDNDGSEDDNDGESENSGESENKGGVTGYSKEIYCVAENGVPALVVIEFDVCPDVVLTLGAAFGWVAMLELAATLVVLAIGMPTGHLKNDQSFLKTMITAVNEEKEMVKSGGIEMGSTLMAFE